jgi:sec-independent protein translocase protein TatC
MAGQVAERRERAAAAVEGQARMGLLEHLEELRSRLLKAALALLVGTLISFALAQPIMAFLAELIGGLSELEAIEPTETIGVFMRVALGTGAMIAMPVLVYQLWRFIAPGLTPQERRYVYYVVPGATLLFLLGIAFAYFIMLPVALRFLREFGDIPSQWRPSSYFGFVTWVMLSMGLSFETPIFVFFLAKMGLVTPRTLARNWRYAVVIIAVIAAVITPTVDPLNMGIVMAPLLALYGLSILLARLA